MVLHAAFNNSGQASNSLKQIFIHDEIYDKFKELLIEGVLSMKLGNPKEDTTYIGPLTDKNYLVDAVQLVSPFNS